MQRKHSVPDNTEATIVRIAVSDLLLRTLFSQPKSQFGNQFRFQLLGLGRDCLKFLSEIFI
jgi:hypothetical protein